MAKPNTEATKPAEVRTPATEASKPVDAKSAVETGGTNYRSGADAAANDSNSRDGSQRRAPNPSVRFKSKYPSYTLGPDPDVRGRLQFVDGVCVTSDRWKIEAARADPAYGIDFWEEPEPAHADSAATS